MCNDRVTCISIPSHARSFHDKKTIDRIGWAVRAQFCNHQRDILTSLPQKPNSASIETIDIHIFDKHIGAGWTRGGVLFFVLLG